jgi:hypothetical protein
VRAVIIGKPGQLRNPELPAELARWFEVEKADGFVAVEPERIPDLVDLNLFMAVHRRPPKVGEVGCALAHLQAWQHLAQSDLPYLAVFEDDAKPLTSDLSHVFTAIESMRGAWYLTFQLLSTDQLVTHAFVRRPRIRRALVQPRATAAYVISREAALLGIADFQAGGGRIQGTSDRWPGPAAQFKFYLTMPATFGSSDHGESYIGSRQTKPEPLLKRIGRFVSILTARDIPAHTKRGVAILKIGRTIRYMFSVHFATEWYSIRWGTKAKARAQAGANAS